MSCIASGDDAEVNTAKGVSISIEFKGKLMQIWKSFYMFVFL